MSTGKSITEQFTALSIEKLQDASCTDHPFHSVALAILEGTNKCISKNVISKHLQDEGLLFLLYQNQYDGQKLQKFIQYLKDESLISNLKKHKTPQQIRYNDLLHKTTSISQKFSSMRNKVYVLNCKTSYNVQYKEPIISSRYNINSTKDWRPDLLDNIKPSIRSINSKTIFDAHSFASNNNNNVQKNNGINTKYPLYPKCSFARNKLPLSNNFNDYISIDIASNPQLLQKTSRLNLVVILDICLDIRKATKIQNCMKQIANNLTHKDKFAAIKLLNGSKKMQCIFQMNRNIHININVEQNRDDPQRLSKAYKKAVDIINEQKKTDDLMNRIMIISDIEDGPHNDDELYSMNDKYSRMDIPIYCSFVAISSWRSFDVDRIYKTRGSNYFCIIDDVEEKMRNQFKFMRSLLIFDLELEMKCDNCKINKMYGNKKIYKFKSKTFAYDLWKDKTKDKMTIFRVKQLRKLNQENDVINLINSDHIDSDPQNIGKEIHIKGSYNYTIDYEFNLANFGKIDVDLDTPISVKSTENTVLLNHYLEKFNELNDDMDDDKDDNDDGSVDVILRYTDSFGKEYNVRRTIYFDEYNNECYYDDGQIRKAVLLINYVNILRAMITNQNYGLYQYIKYNFIPYFDAEGNEYESMENVFDATLYTELKVLKAFLTKYDNKLTKSFVSQHGDKDMRNRHNPIKHMIIGYNPLQSVIITSEQENIKYITHPIHLYKSAYNEGLIDDRTIEFTNVNWASRIQSSLKMGIADDFCSVNESLHILLTLNRYFLIILVPSSVEIDPKYLNEKCVQFSPVTIYYKMHITDFAKELEPYTGKCIFIYRGRFFFNQELNDKDCKDIDLHMAHLNRNVLCDNNEIIYQQDKNPVLHWMIIGCNTVKLSRLELLIFGYININSMEYIPFVISDLIYKFYGKKIKYSKNTMYERKKFYEDAFEFTYDEHDFSDSFAKMLFLCDIDFKMPYNKDLIIDEYRCGICKDLAIDPCRIKTEWIVKSTGCDVEKICSHDHNVFCRNCIDKTGKCPMCQHKIGEKETFDLGQRKVTLTMDNKLKKRIKNDIPITIYNQIKKENHIRNINRKYIYQMNANNNNNNNNGYDQYYDKYKY